MEDQETLETRALISQLADSVKYQVNDFLANSVVTSCIVVGGVFLASDKLFRVEKLAVCTSSNLIYHGRFKIHKDSSKGINAIR